MNQARPPSSSRSRECFENQQKCLSPYDLDAFVAAEIEKI